MEPGADGLGILNKAAEGILLVVPFGEAVAWVLFEVVGVHVEAGDPFGVVLPGIVGDLGVTGPLFAVEGVAGDGDGPVKIADGIFDGEAAVLVNLMVEAELRGKPLAFVALEIGISAVAVAFEILHIAADAVLKTGIDAEGKFGCRVEIEK